MRSSLPFLLAAAVSIGAVIALGGCGLKDDLYLPEPEDARSGEEPESEEEADDEADSRT